MPDPTLRILHVSQWLTTSAGGIQTYLSMLGRALSQCEVENRYAALMPGVAPAFAGTPLNLGLPDAPHWKNVLRLWSCLRQQIPHADVVHVQNAHGWPIILGALLAKRHGVPYVVSPHGTLYPWFLAQRPRKNMLYFSLIGRWLLRGAAAVIVNKPAEQKVVEAIEPRCNAVIAPPGVPVEPQAPIAPPQAGTALRVVFVSRLEPLKAVPVLLQAMAVLRRQGVAAELDVIGKGDAAYMAHLQQTTEQHGVTGNVIFHGFVSESEKQRLLLRSHVFAMPSYAEAFSFATAEALSFGLPAVVSSEVALAETIERYQCGSVVPVDDADALAAALAKYQQPAIRDPASRQAHQCALREFSLEAMGSALEKIYRSAAIAARR